MFRFDCVFSLRFRRFVGAGIIALANALPIAVQAQEMKYPQIVHIRYEAADQRVGGIVMIWVEREKIFYGLDPKLYPAARSVEITHVTPTVGSPIMTTIAVTTVNSTIPDYFHLSGNVRFKISGMVIKSTNVP